MVRGVHRVVLGAELDAEAESKAEQKITGETVRFEMAVEQTIACSRRLKTSIDFCVDLLH